MPHIERPPQHSSPPEAEAGVALNETALVNEYIAGGANSAVGAPRFGRGQLPTLTRA